MGPEQVKWETGQEAILVCQGGFCSGGGGGGAGAGGGWGAQSSHLENEVIILILHNHI